ncbi:MAG: alpha-L-rhamnosidase C-terminal domain-containing protein [bacterium]
MKYPRIAVPPVRPVANSNVLPQYAIQKAKWITHPGAGVMGDQFYAFELAFECKEEARFILHISGDQRFELTCDGNYIGMGPDRSDLRNWSFHSYELCLPRGRHRLAVLLQYIATHRAHAQVSRYPALILAAEHSPVDLNTGTAEWKVSKKAGVSCQKPAFSDKWYQVVGPNFTIDGAAYFAAPERVCPARVPETNLQGGRVGFVADGWRLYPSRLPEQMRKPIIASGRVRMVEAGVVGRMTESASCAVGDWQRLVSGSGELRLKAGTVQTVLWDLEEYHCGYPVLTTGGGTRSTVRIEWAESCFDDESCGVKSDRNRIEGKYYQGYGDTFILRGDDADTYCPFWWRAGRYLRITVEVADEDLCVRALRIDESRLPLENEGAFVSDDGALNAVVPIALRGIQMCAHETYMDCPYYEQMMYVGDARLQLLTSCVISHEPRLHQRAMELLDWSRHVSDFVLMRHPSDPRQLCTTFSMVWIMMIRDLAWWQRDPEFIARLLPGMRAQLEQFRALADSRMLFAGLPGWSFVDWVSADGWDFAYPPEGEFGMSGICNLQFLLTLQSAIEVEGAYGEKHFADSYRDWSKKLADSIRGVFWDPARGAFADDPARQHFSEHAQCLALLSQRFEPAIVETCFQSLLSREDLARTTIYFSFYLLEAFYQQGRGDRILEKMDFWKELVSRGFKAPVEKPEPSRSDCHAWGSHPLFHMHASLCGIRPSSAGFHSVRIAPQPGGLNHLKCRTPHPDGFIDVELIRHGNQWHVSLRLPDGVPGVFEFKGETIPFKGAMVATVKDS